jgi:hypothetical protein
MLAETTAARVLRFVVVLLAQEFFGVVVGVGSWLAVVEMGWWNPFGVAVVVFAGTPAVFGDVVLWGAGQGEVVDVGGAVVRVGVGVVDFAEISGHLAVGEGAAAVFGKAVEVMHCWFRAGPRVAMGHAEGMPHPQQVCTDYLG